jgi:hypothetical protein
MRIALALAAAATLAGTGLVDAPASARTFVSVGIRAPIYPPYPAYYEGYPPPYYGSAYYGPPPVYRGYWGPPRYRQRVYYGRPQYWRDGRAWRGGRRW